MKKEQLGRVTLPSEIALIVDTGLQNLWSHDASPLMPQGVPSDEASTASANSSEDFRIEGPDAEAAGRAFDRQWHPLFLYDIPGNAVAEFKGNFEAFMRSRGLRAHLVSQTPRISHRKRVSLSLDVGKGAGVVQFHGIPAVAVGNLPRTQELPVLGERMGEGAFPDLWRWIPLEVQPTAKVYESVHVGAVAVDWARLMFIDVDALGAWRHNESDGMADFLFWGRDAEEMAANAKADRLCETEFGWTNLSVDLAAVRGMAIERLKQEKQLKVATDFRPHSDHFRLLAQVRSRPTESGTLEVGGALCCGFFTLWGDGSFPVRVDPDKGRAVVRIHIELGTKEAIRNMLAVNALPQN